MQAEAEWAAVSRQLGGDPRWQAVASDEERRKSLGRHCARLRTEAAFAQLLDETPGLAAGTPWPLVKRKVWTDPRYAAVPEARRTQLWREFRAVLAELPAAAAGAPPPAAAQPPAAAAPQQAPAGKATPGLGFGSAAAGPALEGGPAAAAGLGSLTALQAEQARLQLEYAKMEVRSTPSPDPDPKLNVRSASGAASADGRGAC